MKIVHIEISKNWYRKKQILKRDHHVYAHCKNQDICTSDSFCLSMHVVLIVETKHWRVKHSENSLSASSPETITNSVDSLTLCEITQTEF